MKKKTLGIIGIFLVGIALGFILNTFSPVGLTNLLGDDVSSQVEKLYELVNPGVDVSVVKVDQTSGMYKVLFKATDAAGTVSYTETYITTDGKLLTQTIIPVDQYISEFTKIHNFVDCLANKTLRIAGVVNDTGTALQFNVLGGTYAFTKLYYSCDGNQAPQCINNGITQVPAVIFEGRGYAGVQSISFFENLTACKF